MSALAAGIIGGIIGCLVGYALGRPLRRRSEELHVTPAFLLDPKVRERLRKAMNGGSE